MKVTDPRLGATEKVYLGEVTGPVTTEIMIGGTGEYEAALAPSSLMLTQAKEALVSPVLLL